MQQFVRRKDAAQPSTSGRLSKPNRQSNLRHQAGLNELRMDPNHSFAAQKTQGGTSSGFDDDQVFADPRNPSQRHHLDLLSDFDDTDVTSEAGSLGDPSNLEDDRFLKRPVSRHGDKVTQAEKAMDRPFQAAKVGRALDRPSTPSSYPPTTPGGSTHADDVWIVDNRSTDDNVNEIVEYARKASTAVSTYTTGIRTSIDFDTLPATAPVVTTSTTRQVKIVPARKSLTQLPATGAASTSMIERPRAAHSPPPDPNRGSRLTHMLRSPSPFYDAQHAASRAGHEGPTRKSGTVNEIDSSPAPDSTVLDYNAQELGAMDFTELQNEDVDQVDRLQFFGVAQRSKASLEARLSEALAAGGEQKRRDTLEKLSIADWEEAGQWFIERMAEQMQKMVALRLDKRRLALELERQIAARHEVVKRKRRLLEVSMVELRTSGARVLEVGTPSKAARNA